MMVINLNEGDGKTHPEQKDPVKTCPHWQAHEVQNYLGCCG